MNYSTIIVGSGPAGLAYATLALQQNPKEKILIIEKDKTIGGCHKVNRQQVGAEYLFCEHGPRVYFDSYLNFISILNIIGLKFTDLFTKYNLSFGEIGYIIFQKNIFSIREVFILAKDFLITLWNSTYNQNTYFVDYLRQNQFSEKTIDFLDRMCRTMDGGNINTISVNSFFNIINDTSLYSIHQPKIPNDKGLFKFWKNYLEKKGVYFILNTPIDYIQSEKNKIISIKSGKNNFKADQFIMAIPPMNLVNILKNSPDAKDSFDSLEKIDFFSKKTEYIEYISLTFHWDYDLKLNKKLYAINNETDWGVGAIVLSDYIKFDETKSKTVISCAVTITDKKSKNIFKTPNECTLEELKNEVYYQLREIFINLPVPTVILVNNQYNGNKWVSNESAFIKSPYSKYLEYSSKKFENLYMLGTQNGKAKIHYTSLESAVSNAIGLINVIYKTKNHIQRPWNINDILFLILMIIVIYVVYTVLKRR